MKKIDKKYKIVIFVLLFTIFIGIIYFVTKPTIRFKDEYKTIEYGTEYNYEDMIESVKPKDAEIIYPEFKATEVGKYTLTFQFKKGDKIYEKDFSFVIEDSRKPKLTLYFKDESIQTRLNDTNVDLLANIHLIENVNESVLSNKVKLSEDEYNLLKEEINETCNKIKVREISSLEDIEEYDILKNGIFYTTDIDLTTVGNYSMKVMVVDENYNLVETEWMIDVVESDKLLNSGGSVSCEYKGSDLSGNEAYSITSIENYKYNPFKLVSKYEIITIMTFSDDYDTDDNISLMKKELENKYSLYQEYDGVSVTISSENNIVKTSISVDFELYDREIDVLNILKNKDNSDIDMQTVINSADENQYICTIK